VDVAREAVARVGAVPQVEAVQALVRQPSRQGGDLVEEGAQVIAPLYHLWEVAQLQLLLLEEGEHASRLKPPLHLQWGAAVQLLLLPQRGAVGVAAVEAAAVVAPQVALVAGGLALAAVGGNVEAVVAVLRVARVDVAVHAPRLASTRQPIMTIVFEFLSPPGLRLCRLQQGAT